MRRIKIDIIINYFIVIFCILSCNTVYSTSDTFYIPFNLLAVVSAVCAIIIKYRQCRISKRILGFFLFYYFWMGIIIISCVSINTLRTFCESFVLLLPLLMLIFIHDSKSFKELELLDVFFNIVVLLACLSTICWFLIAILHLQIQPTSYVSSYWTGSYTYPVYFGVYTSSQNISILGLSFMRNQCIFTEGPMFNLCLLLAIIYKSFIKNEGHVFQSRKETIKLLICIVADISTGTFAGVIMLFIVVAIYLLSNKRKKIATKILKLGIAMAGIGIMVIVGYDIFLDKTGSQSWVVRMDDYRAGFLAWKASPIVGWGFYNTKAIYPFMTGIRQVLGPEDMGYSNSLFMILANGGIILFSLYLYAFYGYFKRGKENRSSVLFLVLFILLCAVIIFPYNGVMMIFLAFGFSNAITLTSIKTQLNSKC